MESHKNRIADCIASNLKYTTEENEEEEKNAH